MSYNTNLYSTLYFSFLVSHLVSAKKSKLQKQEDEEYQRPQQITGIYLLKGDMLKCVNIQGLTEITNQYGDCPGRGRT